MVNEADTIHSIRLSQLQGIIASLSDLRLMGRASISPFDEDGRLATAKLETYTPRLSAALVLSFCDTFARPVMD